MAVMIPFTPSARVERRYLPFWMDRVLEKLEKVRQSPDAHAVHDLRVALRRCRSLAAVMQEVDAHPAWEEMRRTGRKLFRVLGDLRDAQVQEAWVKQLAPESDPVGVRPLYRVRSDEERLREAALRKAAKFDGKYWRQLAKVLAHRVRLVPPGSPAAGCLALERMEEARELHRRALRTERPKPWHKLRIGMKRFRYTVEGFLPEQHAAWSDDLKRVQDLLGDVHDLDVLLELVREEAAGDSTDHLGEWVERIEKERSARIDSYRQLTLGTTSLWNHWRHGLPSNGNLEIAVMERLRTTQRACDPHRRKTAQTARWAKAIFEAFQGAQCGPLFSDPKMLRVFEATTILHGIHPQESEQAQPREARKFLARLPAPPEWTAEEWNLAGWAIRYHRGKEPKGNGGFAQLSAEQKKRVFLFAGMLRVARALRKIGAMPGKELRAELLPDVVKLYLPGLPDAFEAELKLNDAKHLLERGLGKPLLFVPAEVEQKTLTPPEKKPLLVRAAAASD